jgi:peptidoglycan/LPS O-acetylase OafA/YrhL
MGIIRFLLAIIVVIEHSKPIFGFVSTGGLIAVQTFFIISGFYMSLILNEKYVGKNDSFKLFITNRFLRLFPVYWAVLILTLVCSLITLYAGCSGFKLDVWLEHAGNLNLVSILFLIFTNLFMFGQDAVMFLKLDTLTGALGFTSDYFNTSPQLNYFLMIPQAWSLGLELLFYLVAPFLVRRKKAVIIALIAGSLLLRLAIYSQGLYYDPWLYRFFPTELGLFLFGVISYWIYRHIKSKKIDSRIPFAMLVVITWFILLFQYLPFTVSKQWFFYILMVLFIPFIFNFTKKIKADNLIGELSYPIYISQVLVIYIVSLYIPSNLVYFGIVSIIATVIFSAIIQYIVNEPVEKYRQHRVKGTGIN